MAILRGVDCPVMLAHQLHAHYLKKLKNMKVFQVQRKCGHVIGTIKTTSYNIKQLADKMYPGWYTIVEQI